MSRGLVLLLVGCLLSHAFCSPAGQRPAKHRRPLRADGYGEGDLENEIQEPNGSNSHNFDDDDDDDDDFDEPMEVSPSASGGSNIMSLINLASALFPSSSGANFQRMIRSMIREYFTRNPIVLRRQDNADNVIEIDYVKELTPPFLRQENEDSHDTNESDDHQSNGEEDHDDDNDENDDDDNEESNSHSEEKDNAAEESVENSNTENDKASKQDSGLNDGDDDDDSDYSDEPPGGGDGQGGGVLGLLAGLSGGEDGQSDLGSLLAAVSGIVGSLSGDGFDLNSLIATAFGLFVGLLSEGEENPGEIIASYLLTSLDTITGGGAKNNGAFFGKIISTLVKGTSAVSDESGSSEEGGNKMKMADSAGFFASFLMGLSGDMSKGSSGGSSQPWR